MLVLTATSLNLLEGKVFNTTGIDSKTDFTCIGVGQGDGHPYVVGLSWDQTNNRTRISSHLFKDVIFVGKIIP